MPQLSAPRQKLEALRQALTPADSVLIIVHDYPDPDCLASGFGMQHLLHYWGVPTAVIAFGGFVGRVENRTMIDVLGIETTLYKRISPDDFDRTALVDCFPGNGNVSLPASKPVHAVIDHHPQRHPRRLPFFTDISRRVASTSTLVLRYLRTASCPIPPALATALFYGIKTDTGHMLREVSVEDLSSYTMLFGLCDHHALAQIEHPPLNAGHFRILRDACQAVVSYGNVGYVPLGDVPTPDYVAEMADLFARLARLHSVVCTGVFDGFLFYSIRSGVPNGHADEQAEAIGRAMGGSGGGHRRASAGKIPLQGRDQSAVNADFERTMKTVLRITRRKAKSIL